jgi:endonuclease/exonuclease/phosphatase family metal-dependent hydrolase
MLRLISYNTHWFFRSFKSLPSSRSSPNKYWVPYEKKLSFLSSTLARYQPSLLGLQEVQNEEILQRLSEQLSSGLSQNLGARSDGFYKVASVSKPDFMGQRSGLIYDSSKLKLIAIHQPKLTHLPKFLHVDFLIKQSSMEVPTAVICLHLKAYDSPGDNFKRFVQITHLLEYLSSLKNKEIIVLGDFNMVSYDLNFQRLLNHSLEHLGTSKLHMSPLKASNYSYAPFTNYKISNPTNKLIDHILLSTNLAKKIVKSEVLLDFYNDVERRYSDHWPVYTELAL